MSLEELIDRQAENALIGSLILDPSLADELEVSPSDFQQTKARSVFDAIRKLRTANVEVDILSVKAQVERVGHNGMEAELYISECVTATPSSMNAKYYASRVSDLGTRRAAIQKASRFASDMGDMQKPAGETIAKFTLEMPALARSDGSTLTSSDVASKHWDRMKALEDGKETLTRYQTGVDPYDHITYGGLIAGELVVLSGMPGLGKTKLMVKMAAGLADNGIPVKVYEMETDEDETMDREISRIARIPTDHFVTGMLPEEVERYNKAVDKLSDPNYPLYWSFDPGWSLAGMRADLIKLKAQLGIKVFFVDYLKFMTDSYGEGELQRLNYLIGGLKRICRSLNLAGVVIHSMSKEGMRSQSLTLTDLSQGADIVYDADKVLMLGLLDPKDETPDTQNKECLLVVAKSRRKVMKTSFKLTAVAAFPEFVWNFKKPQAAQKVSNIAPDVNF